jgi:hypothetical protein
MIKLSVVAQAGAAAGDAVEQFIRVEPEGYRVNKNVPLIVDLSSRGFSTSPPKAGNQTTQPSPSTEPPSTGGQFKRTVDMQWPSDFVQGSRRASVEVIGGYSDIKILILKN